MSRFSRASLFFHFQDQTEATSLRVKSWVVDPLNLKVNTVLYTTVGRYLPTYRTYLLLRIATRIKGDINHYLFSEQKSFLD